MNGRLSTSIVIANAHVLFREALKKALATCQRFEVVDEVAAADMLAETVRRSNCDVLLLDGELEGFQVEHVSALASQTGVIVFTPYRDPQYTLTLIRHGAQGVLFHDCTLSDLKDAMDAAGRGSTWLPQDLQEKLAEALREPRRGDITAREREIIRLVARGMRNGEVARALCVSDETVKSHLTNIFRKLGLRDRVELALYAVRTRIIEVRAA